MLGSGANGRVYMARHLRLEQWVAIKLVPVASAPERALARFEREGKAAARLVNEHVARVFDQGLHHSVRYLVQEFVPGESLAARLDRDGALELDAVLDIGVALADGLRAIHEAGIVHRDLKPDNVITTKGGAVKIVDFGIAGEVESSDQKRLTAQGMVLGTPRFMPPEQVSAGREAVTDKSDLYSLGALLHVALTGLAPHEHTVTDSPTALLARRVSEAVEDVRVLRPDVPDRLAELLEQLLEREPTARPTATEALTGLLAARRASRRLHPLTPPEPVADGSAKSPLPLIAGLAFALLLGVGLLVALVSSDGESASTDQSPVARVETQPNAPRTAEKPPAASEPAEPAPDAAPETAEQPPEPATPVAQNAPAPVAQPESADEPPPAETRKEPPPRDASEPPPDKRPPPPDAPPPDDLPPDTPPPDDPPPDRAPPPDADPPPDAPRPDEPAPADPPHKDAEPGNAPSPAKPNPIRAGSRATNVKSAAGQIALADVRAERYVPWPSRSLQDHLARYWTLTLRDAAASPKLFDELMDRFPLQADTTKADLEQWAAFARVMEACFVYLDPSVSRRTRRQRRRNLDQLRGRWQELEGRVVDWLGEEVDAFYQACTLVPRARKALIDADPAAQEQVVADAPDWRSVRSQFSDLFERAAIVDEHRPHAERTPTPLSKSFLGWGLSPEIVSLDRTISRSNVAGGQKSAVVGLLRARFKLGDMPLDPYLRARLTVLRGPSKAQSRPGRALAIILGHPPRSNLAVSIGGNRMLIGPRSLQLQRPRRKTTKPIKGWGHAPMLILEHLGGDAARLRWVDWKRNRFIDAKRIDLWKPTKVGQVKFAVLEHPAIREVWRVSDLRAGG